MKKTISTILFVAMALTCWSQQNRWNVYAGWSLAVGDYAKSDLANNMWALSTGGNYGGAGQGGNVGFSCLIPTSDSSRMSFAVSADLILNGMNSEIRLNNITTLANLRQNFTTAKLKQPLYLHIPLLVGLHFEHPISTNFSFYLTAQAGLGVNIITNRSAELLNGAQPIDVGGTLMYDYTYTDHFSTTTSLAWRVAVGLVEKSHWIADLGLWGMGAMQIRGYEDFDYRPATETGYATRGSMQFSSDRINPLMFIARIGYRL
ncbi:MAG: hypothetical protein IJ785_08230 [Bacteroidales bacterium]|nr:hypothetical protein [Bacteroidales bacterium]